MSDAHTDQSRELLPCPFCGGGITSIRENGRVWTGTHYSDPSSVSVNHHCELTEGQPSRSIERVGRDEASAIAAWNRRHYAIASNPDGAASTEAGLRDCETPTTEQSSGVELPEPVTWLIERHAFSVSPHGQDAEGHSWIEEAHEPGEQGSFAVYTEQQVRALLAGVKESLTTTGADCVTTGADSAVQGCWCTTCRPITLKDMRFVVCPKCGNKRCPRAHNHQLDCTGSNSPGQPGSSWEHVKPVQWCNSCGEGVTTFCRSKTDNCPRGLPLLGKEQA